MNNNKILTLALVAYVIFVFIQSLFYKFTGSEQTEIIFTTIAAWMQSVGLGVIAPTFESIGGYLIGFAELLASVLLLMAGTRRFGAVLGMAIISGAIFFHLFTPLGINRIVDAAGNTDGGILFYMACGVWLSCALIFFLSKPDKRLSAYR